MVVFIGCVMLVSIIADELNRRAQFQRIEKMIEKRFQEQSNKQGLYRLDKGPERIRRIEDHLELRHEDTIFENSIEK